MNTRNRIVLMVALALVAGAALATMTWAAPGKAALAPGGAPTVVSYQGEVRVSGAPYTGNGYFKFAFVNSSGTATYWSNDGTSSGGSEPTAAVQLGVSEGLFSVLLGDTTLGGMTVSLTADAFDGPNRYLRVWFGTSGGGPFDQLTPDTRIAAVPYALQAQEAVEAHTVDGLHASELQTHYQNVVVVAKSGGDYTSVQAAINSITDEAADNLYLVWVAPGVYQEQVIMERYIHLQGAGRRVTVISSAAGGPSWPPPGTVTLASDTSLRDVTVDNTGTGGHNAALAAPEEGAERVLVADVTARALGAGDANYGIVLRGTATMNGVSAVAFDASVFNSGLMNEAGATTTILGGWFTGGGGDSAYGIYNADGGTTLTAEGVTALGEDGSAHNYGLLNDNTATATLHGGSFTGRGGDDWARGIYNSGTGTTLTADNVTAVGEDGATVNYGLHSVSGAAATLQGGWFTGSGGELAGGIYNGVISAALEAEGVTALGENSTGGNYGLLNYGGGGGGTAVLRGGSFTGSGGTDAYGLHNDGSGATLTAEGVTALGEEGTAENHGLYNHFGATAMLSGGSFTGRGSNAVSGIFNDGGGTSLEAVGVAALGENGATNAGLRNGDYALATLHGGFFAGRGGDLACGILNYSSADLTAEGISALGQSGAISTGLRTETGATADVTQSVLSGSTSSVNEGSGSVTVSNSRLVDGPAGSGVTCVGVSRGTTFNASGCP